MKKSVLLLTLMTALTIQTQGKEALCGIVYQDSLVRTDTIVISIYDFEKSDYIERSVKAVSSEARYFLENIEVHGAKICNPRAAHDASFEICFADEIKRGQAKSIFCGKKRGCKGLHCGGNGFSVNSGS